MIMKNKETKAITFKAPTEIMDLIERYQKARRKITGPPQMNRPPIVVQFLEAFKEDIEPGFIIVCFFFWPILIVGAIVACVAYYVFRLIAMPIIGADKYDLKVLGDKMEDTIDTKITREDNKIMRYLESDYVPPKAKRKAKEPAKVSKKKVKKGKK